MARFRVYESLLAAVVIGSFTMQADAQNPSGGIPPIQNAAGAGSRSPGELTTSAIARQNEILVSPIPNWDNIVDEPEISPYEAVWDQAQLLLAQQFVALVDLLVDALLIRSGIEIPTTTDPPDDSGNGDGRNGGGRNGTTRKATSAKPIEQNLSRTEAGTTASGKGRQPIGR